MVVVQLCENTFLKHELELKIRGGIEENSKLIFLISQKKTYVVTPH